MTLGSKVRRPHISTEQLDAEYKYFNCANCGRPVVFLRFTGNVIHNKQVNFCSEYCMHIYLIRIENE